MAESDNQAGTGAGRAALGIARPALPERSRGIAGPPLEEPTLRVPALLFLQ